MILLEVRFYKKGTLNKNAGALSRIEIKVNDSFNTNIFKIFKQMKQYKFINCRNVNCQKNRSNGY